MVISFRMLAFLLAATVLFGLLLWQSNQRLNAESHWLEDKLSQPQYADALLGGCYEVSGAQLFFPTKLQKQNILECLRWELSEMARFEGVELSEGVLDSKLKSVSNQIRSI